MGGSSYERLSAQDSTFVRFEAQGSHAHITAIAIFDAGPLLEAGTGLDVDRLRAHVWSRLHRFPRYRKRLAYTPVQGHPIWVDDDRFDIAQHVCRTGLPAPGGDAELKDLAGRLTSQPLDLSRPAWQMWFVEGLADNRFAIVAKIHHSLIDGVSGVGVLTALLSPLQESEIEPAPAWRPEPMPSALTYLVDGVTELGEFSLSTVQTLGSALWNPRRTVESVTEGAGAAWETLVGVLTPSADTPLNAPPGQQRRLEWFTLDLATIRDLRKRLDGSLNDVVLTLVTGAVRRRLRARKVPLRGMNFRATVPVDVRGPDDAARANKVSAWFLSLPVGERDARRRFGKVREQTSKRKRLKADQGVDLFNRLADWTGSSLLSTRFADIASFLQPYNILVTNVHGPQVPIYLLGAPLVALFPALPLFANQGTAVAVMSYLDKLHIGLTGDWDLMPDLLDFAHDLREATKELQSAAETIGE